jgi:hypothetical protein
MKTIDADIEKICLNCGAFFPASFDLPNDFGVCLNDPEFDPFVDDILDREDFTSCQELVERKKFNGEREACSDFEPIEDVEIEDDTPLGRDLKRLMDAGQLNADTFREALFEDQVRNIDWATMPVDRQKAELGRPDTQDRAVKSLGGMIALGNREAFVVLSQFLKDLPIPNNIEEVHFRKDILGYLRRSKEKGTLLPFLVDALYRTPSNNTTRQWISDILKFMEDLPFEDVCEPLERMLEDKRFSYRLKQKMEDVLIRAREAR